MALAVGIDLGGTALKAGLVTDIGEIVHSTSIATRADEGADAVIDRIAELALSLLEHADRSHEPPLGVGVGAPGTIDRDTGRIVSAPNLLGWQDVPLADRLIERLCRPVVLNNDANNAALGEFIRGAGRGASDMVMLTLGTGIGGGVISGGRLFVGSRGNAGELGHAIVVPGGRRCNCGQFGCLEAYASASSTAQRAKEAVAAGEDSLLAETLHRSGAITSEDVVTAAGAGDALAQRVWGETCRYLAAACINIQHAFDPACIVLAGGMSRAGDALVTPLNAAIREMISPTLGPMPQIRLAELGADAGFVGAALSVHVR